MFTHAHIIPSSSQQPQQQQPQMPTQQQQYPTIYASIGGGLNRPNSDSTTVYLNNMPLIPNITTVDLAQQSVSAANNLNTRRRISNQHHGYHRGAVKHVRRREMPTLTRNEFKITAQHHSYLNRDSSNKLYKLL